MNNVIEQFNFLLKEKKIKSMNNAADAMGISGSALSQYLKGIYQGNTEKVEKKVIEYIQLIKERELIGDDEVKFIKGLRNTQLVLDVARLVHVRRTIGLITGRAGFGKTLALSVYAQEKTDSIFIEADGGYNAKEVLKEIAETAGFNGKGHLNTLKKEIINKLKDSGRIIIIDQAEYLPAKALDLLRTIHDKAGVGLLLAGLPILQSNIKGVDGIHEQIYTRIGAAVTLDQPSDDDLVRQIRNYISDTSLDETFIKESRRNPRVLFILVREAKRIAKNKNLPISVEIIKRASKQLLR